MPIIVDSDVVMAQRKMRLNSLAELVGITQKKGYETFLHEYMFKPAGMIQTGYRIPKWESKDFAVGYRSLAVTFRSWLVRAANWVGADDQWGTPLDQNWAKDGPWWNLRANGGLLSTLNDLYRWHLALKNNLVLSEKSIEKLYSPPHINTPSQYYGYGWHVEKSDGGINTVYHTGGNPYFFLCFITTSEVMLYCYLRPMIGTP